MSDRGRAFTILHGSDLHFGRPHAPAAATDFLTLAHALSPDLIALSGDFTQRAKNREYEAAAAYLKRLPRVPLVVTPGNHDVPLYRLWERAFAPFRNYRRWIADELDSEHDLGGAVVVALNTTTPDRTIVNGNVADEQLERAAAAFARAGNGGLRALVVHHALVGAPEGDLIAALPRARRIVARLAEMGVELVLFGHLHRAFISVGVPSGPSTNGSGEADSPVLLVCSGTTASDRGRGREKGKNSCNLVRVTNDRIAVTRYLRCSLEDGFRPVARDTFPRHDFAQPPSPGTAGSA
ncbi:MAG: metallophosphoesterase [Gammaproteobacteria bacterium]|nr:metallophosphoesterase [Gammaproteobacteria bacterium]